MNARIDQLFDEARSLACEDRSMLALALLDSLQGDQADEAAVEKAWITEARSRAQLLRDGLRKTAPWLEARARISAL
jgi:Putative addiction module component